MLTVKEIKYGNESTFKFIVSNANKIDYEQTIHFKSVIKEYSGYNFMYIYTPSMEVISSVFEFLNFQIRDYAINSRIKALQALKLLYTFQKVIDTDFTKFTAQDVMSFRAFLRGHSSSSNFLNLQLITSRTASTVNGYFSVYRDYAKFLGVKKTALLHRTNVRGAQSHHLAQEYYTSIKTPTNKKEVPWYISVDEFYKICDFVRKDNDIVAEIIVRLMYESGLRIGEVLGLTNDDIFLEKAKEGLVPMLTIRNRVSDATYQKAKTCMKVFTKNDYITSDYSVNNYGYQRAFASYELYDLINDYIESTHAKYLVGGNENIHSSIMADRVVSSDDITPNFYIFVNKYDQLLTAQTWNIRLRRIFETVNIHVDKNKKKHNLNHRFRHGFAMYHIKYQKIDKVELAELMRHRSILSVEQYYKPTIADQAELKNKFVEDLYDLIPSLRRNSYE